MPAKQKQTNNVYLALWLRLFKIYITLCLEQKGYTSDNLLQVLENDCNRFLCQWRRGAVIFDAVSLKPDYSKTLCKPLYITKININ